MPKQKIQTAKTMTVHPEGTRLEEFLTDEDLVAFYERQADALVDDDPAKADLRRQTVLAKRAAAMTATGPEVAELALAAEAKKGKG